MIECIIETETTELRNQPKDYEVINKQKYYIKIFGLKIRVSKKFLYYIVRITRRFYE